MKLMTKEIEQMLPALYATDGKEDKQVIVKYFNPCGAGTWYGIEYNPEEKLFFGYVDLYGDGNGELGYFSLVELESINLPFGLKIERDIHFSPTSLKELINKSC